MLAQKSNGWCVVKNCNKNIVEKRHLFRFPKEHDRWLQWIRACERLDLEAIGAEYAHRNFRVCHLHFEEKWYNISKTRAYLHPDAVPTKFFEENNASITSEKEKMNDEIPAEDNISEQEKINSDLQPKPLSPVKQMSRCDIYVYFHYVSLLAIRTFYIFYKIVYTFYIFHNNAIKNY